jgi:excinuclease ABC subunit C
VAAHAHDFSIEDLDRIPTSAGVYLMKDHAGVVVYVGKAKNLRTRVRQYFRPGGDARFFVAAGLLGRVLADVETIVVDDEKQALLLENHLIKRHQPRFNIKLRDDKQYLVLRIEPPPAIASSGPGGPSIAASIPKRTLFPRVEVVRNIRDDGARYFGPYHSASSCRETLRTLNRYFQLRTCTDHVLETRQRPCLQYQIKRCPGPCVYDVPPAQYREQVDDVMMFLSGKSAELVERLQGRMDGRSAAEEFEVAALLRDSIAAIKKTVSRQQIVQEDFVDQDVVGMWREADVVELIVLFVRAGKLIGRRSFRLRDQEFPDGEVLANFVQQYYATGTLIPDEILVGAPLAECDVIAEWLSEQAGRKIKIVTPQRQMRRRLLDLANKNASASAASRSSRDDDVRASLEKLQLRLGLKRWPRRIECFDIAHIQGTATVASMVVFIDGVAERSLYRTFKVKEVGNDDFASMYEVLTRRFRHAVNEIDPEAPWAAPDLLVIDGGKGQLNSALAALADLGIEITSEQGFDVVGLAKERDDTSGTSHPDRVFLRNTKDPITLRPNTAELYLLARVRDEAHRFANTFHRGARKRSTLRSQLDDIPGIGEKRRKQLLRHFGSVKAVRAATAGELAAVAGMTTKAAEAVRAFFARLDGEVAPATPAEAPVDENALDENAMGIIEAEGEGEGEGEAEGVEADAEGELDADAELDLAGIDPPPDSPPPDDLK